jgi:hypothetical protein
MRIAYRLAKIERVQRRLKNGDAWMTRRWPLCHWMLRRYDARSRRPLTATQNGPLKLASY